MNGGNLGNGEAAIGEQDHLRVPGHPPDGLGAKAGAFIWLRLRQGHVDHSLYPHLSEAAGIMPYFWLCARYLPLYAQRRTDLHFGVISLLLLSKSRAQNPDALFLERSCKAGFDARKWTICRFKKRR